MNSPAGRPAPPVGGELAGLARRVVALGIAVGAPIIAVTWFREGATDPWVLWGYPPLGAALLVFGWVLLRKQEWAVRTALTFLVFLEVWLLVVASGRISQAPDAESAWASLLPTPLLAVVVCLIVGFLFQGARTALVHGGIYAALFTALVAVQLARGPATDYVWISVRYGVYLGVFLVLLLVLSRAKEHVTTAVEDAARAEATASTMRDMANQDALTGLANRRRLVEVLSDQARLVGPSHPVAVVYFDLDHFKQLNDTFGHGVGDQVLRLVAEIGAQVVRDGDVLARVGGEEFVLVAPATEQHQALRLAERLRELLAEELMVAVGVRVTASFGVTALQAEETAASVLGRVDALMYLAKAGGRNRVHAEGPARA